MLGCKSPKIIGTGKKSWKSIPLAASSQMWHWKILLFMVYFLMGKPSLSGGFWSEDPEHWSQNSWIAENQLSTAIFTPDVFHVFVKKYPAAASKLGTNTRGIRTVTASWLPTILRDACAAACVAAANPSPGALLHDLDKRMSRRWHWVPFKLGMPLNAWGFNIALSRIAHHKRFFSLDACAFDYSKFGSTIPTNLAESGLHKPISRKDIYFFYFMGL